jgi:hypothetical protein
MKVVVNLFGNRAIEMKTLRCEDISIGMRVLLTNPDEDYAIGRDNPVVGSEWECIGIVDYCNKYDEIGVSWDNGKHNGYKDNELSECLDGIEGRCKSIW